MPGLPERSPLSRFGAMGGAIQRPLCLPFCVSSNPAGRQLLIARRPAPTGFTRSSTKAIALWRGEIPSAKRSCPASATCAASRSRSARRRSQASCAKSRPGVRLNEHLEHPKGHVVFREACKLGVERHRLEAPWLALFFCRSPDWLKFKNPAAPAVKREAEEDWGR
jgi:hypothetical protein